MWLLSSVIALSLMFEASILVAAQSNQTTLTVEVPSHCSLQVCIVGRGAVSINGNLMTESKTLLIQRLSRNTIEFQSGIGYQIATVSLNGTDITEEIHSEELVLEGLSSDGVLSVVFAKKSAGWPGSNPPTGDSIMCSVICCSVSIMGLLIVKGRKREQ